MYYIYEALSFLEFQIESLTAYDDNLLVGTRQGHLLIYSVKNACNSDRKPHVQLLRYIYSFCKKPIQQLHAVPEYQMLICLSDNIISIHDMSVFNFPFFSRIRWKGGKKLRGIATLFTVDVKRQVSLTGVKSVMVRMCVVRKQQLRLFYWENGAFLKLADVMVEDMPCTILGCQETLCIGFKGKHMLLKLSDLQFKLLLTAKQLEPSVTKLSDDTFVLSMDSTSIFVNTAGGVTLNDIIKWSEVPIDIACDEPYVLALLSESVEVCTYGTSLHLQNLSLKGAHIIRHCRPGLVYVASTEHVWILRSDSIASQNLFDDSKEEKANIIHQNQILFAFDLFDRKRFHDSVKEFLKLQTDPYEVIQLYSSLVPQQAKDDITTMKQKQKMTDAAIIELEEQDLENGLLAFIEYLTKVQKQLLMKKMPIKSLEWMQTTLQIIDTALLKCYLQILKTYPENFHAYKVLIAARYGSVNMKLAPGFVFGESNKIEWFLHKFPVGKVPAFESSNGTLLTNSNAIAYYVSIPELRGRSPTENALVLQWLCFADNKILPASCTWVFSCLSITQCIKKVNEQAGRNVPIGLSCKEVKRAKDAVRGVLTTLDNYLQTHTYLVGKRVTVADIAVACALLHLYQYVLEPDFRQSYENVNQWFTSIVNQPEAKAVLGDFKFCEKADKYNRKKFHEFKAKGKGKKVSENKNGVVDKENNVEKGVKSNEDEYKMWFTSSHTNHHTSQIPIDLIPPPQPPPKQPPPPEKKGTFIAVKPNYENVNQWLASIVNQPEATAVLGDSKFCEKAAEYDPKIFKAIGKGKKVGVNKNGVVNKQNKIQKGDESQKEAKKKLRSTREPGISQETIQDICVAEKVESIPLFWKKFGKGNYSIWHSEYKLENLEKNLIHRYLITRMMQRLHQLKKCAFASVCLFGTDNDSTISGIWVWRGEELAFEMSADWQVVYKSYQWTKLDIDKAETRDLVAQHIAWQVTDNCKFNFRARYSSKES